MLLLSSVVSVVPLLLLHLLLSFNAVGVTNGAPQEEQEQHQQSPEEEDSFTLPPLPTLPPVGVCQTYSGKLCQEYLKDAYVFVAPNKTVQDVETELSTVYNIFRQSK